MRESFDLVLGGVYKTALSDNPIRLISFDENIAFYDTWWESLNDWGYKNNLKSKIFFYRTSPNVIQRSHSFLRIDPLSEIERNIYKPDLPFAFCRNIHLIWNNNFFSTLKEYEAYLLEQKINIDSLNNLDVSEIFLVPFGEKGGHKKSVKVKAIDGKMFSGIELLWNAHNAQASYIKDSVRIENGVGVYRLGFEKSMPSFYIGGYYDSAELLKK